MEIASEVSAIKHAGDEAQRRDVRGKLRHAGGRFFVKARRSGAGILAVLQAAATLYWRKRSGGGMRSGADVGI